MKEGMVSTEKKRILQEINIPLLAKVHEWFKTPKRVSEKIVRMGMYVLIIDLAFVFIFPFLFMLVTSLKTNTELYDITVNWVPKTLKFENYIIAFRALDYAIYSKNSLMITIMATIGHLLSCSFIGYGLARYQFPGKKILIFVVIIAMIVPVQTIIVPLYIVFANLKWLNTYLPVIVPTFFGYGLKGSLFLLVFRQFYLGLPKELENAAKIDGCGFIMTYWRIALPIARSAFLVTLLLSLVWHWNDFYEPAIYASKPSQITLPARLNELVAMVNRPPEGLFDEMALADGESTVNNAVLMAGICMVVMPVIAVFATLQKKFMQGIERTGLTGE